MDELSTSVKYYGYRVRRSGQCSSPKHSASTCTKSPEPLQQQSTEGSVNVSQRHDVVTNFDVFTLSRLAVGSVLKDFRQEGKRVTTWLNSLPSADLCALHQRCSSDGHVIVNIAETQHQLEPRHLELKCDKGDLGFARVSNGWLAPSNNPGLQTIESWRLQGVTCVISLLRETECPTFNETRKLCIEKGIKWINAPLSGKNGVTFPDEQDLESWGVLNKLLPQLLHDGEHVVVHCSAGKHRTGSVVFRGMRACGYCVKDALSSIQQMRKATYDGLCERIKTDGPDELKLYQAADILLGGPCG